VCHCGHRRLGRARLCGRCWPLAGISGHKFWVPELLAEGWAGDSVEPGAGVWKAEGGQPGLLL